jgi:hypothetical protein
MANVHGLNFDFLNIKPDAINRKAIMPIKAINRTASVLSVPKIQRMLKSPNRISNAPLKAGSQDLSYDFNSILNILYQI